MEYSDMIGKRFGRLVVVSFYKENDKPKNKYLICQCDCGNTKIVQKSNLQSGNTSSCGCYRKEKIKETNSKKNIYEFINDYVVGYDVRENKPFTIDLDDYEKIKDITWTRDSNGYVIASRTYDYIGLSRYILDCHKGDGIVVDHINGDINNNRKYNLRKTNKSINSLNRNPKGNGRLGTLGVRKTKNRYEARIKIDGEDIFIGSFLTLEEAEQARINYEQRLSKQIGEVANARRK